jgi:hypothetical protein
MRKCSLALQAALQLEDIIHYQLHCKVKTKFGKLDSELCLIVYVPASETVRANSLLRFTFQGYRVNVRVLP